MTMMLSAPQVTGWRTKNNNSSTMEYGPWRITAFLLKRTMLKSGLPEYCKSLQITANHRKSTANHCLNTANHCKSPQINRKSLQITANDCKSMTNATKIPI